MTQLGDYQVKTPTGGNGDEPLRGPMIVIGIVALLAVAIGLYWFLGRDIEDPPDETMVEATPDPVSPPSAVAEAEPEPVDASPLDLDGSDAFIREVIGTISSHAGLAEWIVSDGLIRRFVVVVDNIADGSNPAQHLPFMRPMTRFRTSGEGATLQIDARSYRRYDLHAQIIASLDTHGTADLYLALEPLMNEAYVELGNPDRPFAQTLERAIVSLLNAPTDDGLPALVEHAPLFQYTDTTLESLTPAQKQLLGMGPDNVRTVQAKLRQMALAIGIPDSRLP